MAAEDRGEAARAPGLVALTGATGLVGRSLVPLLLARGWRVRALARERPGRELPRASGLEWVLGRLDERAPLDALVRDADLIVHMAYEPPAASPVSGRSDVEHWIRTNQLASMRLLERTAATRGRQMVYVSSLAVYGDDPDQDPLGERYERDESFPIWPRDFYGALRSGVETMVVTAQRVFGWNTSVFRLGCVLGLREPARASPLAPTVLEALRHGEIRTAVGTYALSAEDSARLLADAAGDPSVAGTVFNAFDRWVDHAAEAAPILERVLGRRVRVACAPARQPRGPIRNARVRARLPRFETEEALARLLEALAGRLGPSAGGGAVSLAGRNPLSPQA